MCRPGWGGGRGGRQPGVGPPSLGPRTQGCVCSFTSVHPGANVLRPAHLKDDREAGGGDSKCVSTSSRAYCSGRRWGRCRKCTERPGLAAEDGKAFFFHGGRKSMRDL